ncbi:hypothetical protein SEA_MEMENTOMORI_87 [Microbacterium phage MementoMori]|uniref:Uncharacterized protein n=1 Tax=Microbacterium phage MementoMori TaxID=2201436 RepID=A0A2Z4Q5Q4_9CAUD|nr:hypothetical protein HOT41_gp22 [Microbacterium phage MementoMori]AWY05341.1 hypothetical protein SEA_MEMENTOMORI_87 [Microbacterium phage MementoMori]
MTDLTEEQTRAIQANEIAYTVIEVAQNKAPEEFVTLDFRYGIADALWDAGYRKGTDHGAACLHVSPDDLKALREMLCRAQRLAGPMDSQRMGALIAEIDRNRPLGSDGKHGDLHTTTCGCVDR